MTDVPCLQEKEKRRRVRTVGARRRNKWSDVRSQQRRKVLDLEAKWMERYGLVWAGAIKVWIVLALHLDMSDVLYLVLFLRWTAIVA